MIVLVILERFDRFAKSFVMMETFMELTDGISYEKMYFRLSDRKYRRGSFRHVGSTSYMGCA